MKILVGNSAKELLKTRKIFQSLFLKCHNVNKNLVKILGIETSCDDTGVAIVNGEGEILGEGYHSQVKTTVKLGGIVPVVAIKYHKDNITKAADDAFNQSGLNFSDITAVAATTQPGNSGTLLVGAEFGKNLALKYNLPFIPIHHMQAHALTVRMLHKVDFPFVVLLMSGGHCILALAQSLDDWLIVGETQDMSPGNSLDLIARRLKIRNIPGYDEIVGGSAIEILAKQGDPKKYEYASPMSKWKCSNFSLSGLNSHTFNMIKKLENENGIEGGNVLDEVSDICASFQHSLTKHLQRKTHTALRFLENCDRINIRNKVLVLSGGVASNLYIRNAFQKLCDAEGYRLFVPPPKLCTDNGVMIAWNGVERWMQQSGVLTDRELIKNVSVHNKSSLGPNISEEQIHMGLINPKWIKF